MHTAKSQRQLISSRADSAFICSCRQLDIGGSAEARLYGVVLDQTVLVPPAQGYIGDCGCLELVDHALGPQVSLCNIAAAVST